jgi:cytochrome b561
MNPPQKYHLTSRILHWSMAAIILGLLGIGIYMTEFLPKEASNRFQIYDLHKSFGVIILLLIFVRIINRILQAVPALPSGLPKYEKLLSHLVHIALYILMILVPLSGYLMSNSFGFPVHLFTIQMPFIISTNQQLGRLFAKTHEVFAFSLLALVILHFIGAIKHRFFDRPENDVLNRML